MSDRELIIAEATRFAVKGRGLHLVDGALHALGYYSARVSPTEDGAAIRVRLSKANRGDRAAFEVTFWPQITAGGAS